MLILIVFLLIYFNVSLNISNFVVCFCHFLDFVCFKHLYVMFMNLYFSFSFLVTSN